MARRWMALFSLVVGFVLVITSADSALGHSGGTNANGCHAGSQPYHCHGSRSAPAPRAPSGGLTLCADGVYSQSTGSGTCSSHGGIAGNKNPSSTSGSTDGGGGAGRIVPGSGQETSVGTRTLPSPSSAPSSAYRTVSGFVDNGGIVYLLVGWWVIAKIRKSRRDDSPDRPVERSRTTTNRPPAPKASSAAVSRPVKSGSVTRAATPTTSRSSAQAPGSSRTSSGSCACGGREVLRKNRKTGQRFFGCSRYPSCRRTRPLG